MTTTYIIESIGKPKHYWNEFSQWQQFPSGATKFSEDRRNRYLLPDNACWVRLNDDRNSNADPTTYHASIPQVREAIFTVLDAGDPERGGDPWALDVVDGVTVEDVTENRYRFVEAVTGILVGKAQDAINATLTNKETTR